MTRPVSPLMLAVTRGLEPLRRGAVRVAGAVRGRYDAAPGWLRRLLHGAGGLLLAAVVVGGLVGLSAWGRRLGVIHVVPVRVWGTAGLVQLAAGGALALAAVTLTGEDRGDGRLDQRGGPAPRGLRLALAVVTVLAVAGAVLLAAGVAHAAPAAPPPAPVPAVTDLKQVITNMRNWLMGLLAGAATLFASMGGLRYMGANGDPAEVERAKGSFKAAGIGYGLAILAPVLLAALQSVVGG
ncbi:pilin [Frankia sp. AgPm24]|uniref:pilin n=1 Tax=Frankia sp. AgPm24 TaxID=631128 RepID=UPI00201029E6|nr:pilin [Frankia sp. AgPm24]MCK9921916.1 pilin [Frankia sp. AgPm24]